MRRFSLPLILIALTCSLAAASWMTFGGNPQRDGWAKDESIITKDSVKTFQLLWKTKLDNEPKQLNSLTSPVVINPVYTNHGAEAYVIVGGSSDNLFAIDSEDGKVVWQKHFTNDVPPPTGTYGSYFCPDALNDTPIIQSSPLGNTVYVISIDGKLHGLNVVNGEDRFPPKPFVPAYSKNWSLNLDRDVIYTTTSQGCGHARSAVWAMDLKSPEKAVTYFQSGAYGAGIWGRGGASIGSNGAVYAETGDGAYDPITGKFGECFLKLGAKDLGLQDYYSPANANYLMRKDLDMGNSTPVVFTYKGRELLVGSGKEGALFLLDSKSLGGETHRKPLFQTPLYTNEGADIAGRGFWGAFASWEDPKGTRWVYAPAWGPTASKAPVFPVTNGAAPNGSIMAFKVEDGKDGQPGLTPAQPGLTPAQPGLTPAQPVLTPAQPVLTPAWISRDMNVPEPPVVANGVVFAISSGEFTRQVKENGALYTTEERIQLTAGNASLYAFDAETGKELFSSGKTMPSFTHFGALAVDAGRVFVTTHDSTLYAFGIKGE
ncbi:MAG: PQQ-binding-like beta-propeller repeat protein [Bryobacteraceae bacterium]